MNDIGRIAILDDYQGVAPRYADWNSVPGGAPVTLFREHLGSTDDVVAALAPFDVIVAMRERTAFSADVLSELPNLRLLVTTGPANAAIDVGAARSRGIVVSGTRGGGLTSTIELTWGLILALARHIPAEDHRVRQGGWQHTIGADLHGRRLGVIGLGGIGSAVARVGQAFGMDVVAWSAHLDANHARDIGVTPVAFADLLATSDVATIHLKLSTRTTGLIGRDEIAAMKPTALLINTSRGPILDEDALLSALHAGIIGGAGIDVYGSEPLPPDSPWRTAPRTVLTPHLGFVSEATYEIFYADAREDIVAYANGAPIRELTV